MYSFAYVTFMSIFMCTCAGDKDVNRRTSVRYKTEKYLLRAEKIYNMHLSPEMRSFHELVCNFYSCSYLFSRSTYLLQTQVERECTVDRHISDLYKYKVVKVIGSGMLTLHSDLQQLFFVKVYCNCCCCY